MIPALRTGCAAVTNLYSPFRIGCRSIGFRPFVYDGSPFKWSRKATFIPTYMYTPITIGGAREPRRSFGNEEDVGVNFQVLRDHPIERFTIFKVQEGDWKTKGELLVHIKKVAPSAIEFPKGSLLGKSDWAEDLLETLAKGRTLQIIAVCTEYSRLKGVYKVKNPTAVKMDQLALKMSVRETRHKETRIEGIHLSTVANLKSAAKLLSTMSQACTLTISFA